VAVEYAPEVWPLYCGLPLFENFSEVFLCWLFNMMLSVLTLDSINDRLMKVEQLVE
jgi:hypothetical protein